MNSTRKISLLLLLLLVTPVCGFQRQKQVDEADIDLIRAGLIDENSLFVPAPRESLRPLLQSQRAINNREYARAVALLGETLSESSDEDFLVRDNSYEGNSVSLRQMATQLLGLVPVKERELYELRYGIQAKHSLDKAIDDYDFFAMSQIMDRYFYTRAGFDATMLVGHSHLDNGRPIAAAFCFRRIVDVPEARRIHDPEASVLLATCWMLTGDESKAIEVLQNLKHRLPDPKIFFLGKSIALFDRDDQAADWLRKLVGESALATNRKVREWVMFGGNPQRNASSGSGFPLLNARWSVPTLNNPDFDAAIKNVLQDLYLEEASTIPAVHPIAAGDTVIMRTHDQMIGIDFKSGRRVWSYPSLESELLADDETTDDRGLAKDNLGSVRQRLFEDAIYGQTSSDGRNVFVIPHPGFATGKRYYLTLRGGGRIQHPLASRRYNELISIDINRQGAFSWEVGGKDGLSEPKLAAAFFLGPPLPIDNELYAICEQAGEIRLVVLDSKSGKLIWSQQLAIADSKKKSVSTISHLRLAGAVPSFSDGILVCPTGHGALVAIDVATRTLLWGFQYGSAREIVASRIAPMANSKQSGTDPFWKDASVKIADGAVIYTPVDRNDTICLNLGTGRPLWSDSTDRLPWIQREDSLFVGAVDQQRMLLVGGKDIRAISMADGGTAWRIDTSQHGAPSGHGYTNNGFYYQPTTLKKLIQVDIKTGKIVKAIGTDGVLGNLVCYRGSVISHGVDRVAAFPDSGTVRKSLAVAESKGDELDSKLLGFKSQLMMQDGKYREAVEAIAIAYEKDPSRVNEKILTNLLLNVVEHDHELGQQLAEKYSTKLVSVRPRLHAAIIDGLIRDGELEEASMQLVDQILPLAQSKTEFSYLQNLNDSPLSTRDKDNLQKGRDGNLTIRFDRWLRSRVTFLMRRMQVDERDAFGKRLSEIANSESIESLEVRLRVFRLVGAENLNPELLRKFSEEFTGNGFVWAGPNPADSKGAMESANEILEEALPPLKDFQDWSSGLAITSVGPNDGSDQMSRSARCEIVVRENNNPLFNRFQFRYYFNSTGQFEVLDQYGNEVTRISTRDATINKAPPSGYYVKGEGRISGHLMVVNVGCEIFAVDLSKLLEGESGLLWSHDIAKEQVAQFTVGFASTMWGERIHQVRGKSTRSIPPVFASAPSSNGVCYVQESRLVCVDMFTGEICWQRTGIGKKSELFGDDDHVIVWDEDTRLATVYERLSGQFLSEVQFSPEFGPVWDFRANSILFSQEMRLEVEGPDEKLTPQEQQDVLGIPTIRKYKKLKLYDVVKSELVWERKFEDETVACRIRNEMVAALLPSGNLEVIDVETGQIELSAAIGLPELGLSRAETISVLEIPGAYLVKLHCSKTRSNRHDNSSNIRLTGSGNNLFWNGFVAAIDRETGKPLWPSPVRTQFVNFSANQPYASPMLVAYRRLEHFYLPRSNRYWSQFIAIDLRNGKTVVNEKTAYSNTNDIRIEVEPGRSGLKLQTSTQTFRIFLTDEVPPPRPTALITSDNSISFKPKAGASNFKPVEMTDDERKELIRQIKSHGESLPKRRDQMQKQMEKQKK